MGRCRNLRHGQKKGTLGSGVDNCLQTLYAYETIYRFKGRQVQSRLLGVRIEKDPLAKQIPKFWIYRRRSS